MAKNISGASPSEPLEDLDLDAALPPLESNSEPSSNNDSTVNLDEYGIWVKGEPEDFTELESFDGDESVLEDLSLEEAGESAVSAAENAAFDELDIPVPEEESLAAPAEETAGGQETEETIEEVEIEETPSFEEEAAPLEEDATADEEFNFPELNHEATADEGGQEASAVLEEEAVPLEEAEGETAGGGEFEEVSLDDLGIEISSEPAEEDGAVKAPAERKPAPQAAADEAAPHVIDDEFASLSLDLESEEKDTSTAHEEDKSGFELSELELPDEETIEAEVETSGEEGTGEAPALRNGGGDFEEPESLEEIPELDIGTAETADRGTEKEESGEEIEVPLSDEVAIAESEEELGSLGGAPAGTASNSILKSIEAELRSIKSELAELKSELGALRAKKPAVETEGRRAAGSDVQEGEKFFEEEEDETIALTGEELDNILTTADIKEEEKPAPAEAVRSDAEPDLELAEDIIGYDEQPVDETTESERTGKMSADEGAPDKESGTGEGEIEIEIPELEGGPDDILAAEETVEIEPMEDLSTAEEAAGGDAVEPSSTEDLLEEVEEIGLETESARDAEPEAFPAAQTAARKSESDMQLPSGLKEEIKSVLSYMDQLLESLPEEKIEEFAKSEYFSIYKKLFEELGLVS